MDTIQEIKLNNGQVLVSITGYGGEDDFYLMYEIIQSLLNPEHITYGVDSMCVDGSFRKDGLLVRMSSECVPYCCFFHYDPRTMTDDDVEKIKGWISSIVAELHQRKPV